MFELIENNYFAQTEFVSNKMLHKFSFYASSKPIVENVSLLVLSILLLFIAACSTHKNVYVSKTKKNNANLRLSKQKKIATLYLIGDTGTDKNYNKVQQYIFAKLQSELSKADSNTSIVFLGDNIYPAGLPDINHNKRKEAEKKINSQLNFLKDFKGNTYFIPGNHDWNEMSAGGLEAVKRQEKYIENYYADIDISFLPDNGCGDPIVKHIDKKLCYIFIDTQWWLQNWKKEHGINKGCTTTSRKEFLNQLETIFDKNKDKKVVLLMHHPLLSNGEHGGKFAWHTHLFPLRTLNEQLWLPLPVLGSLQPIIRGLGGIRQDIPNRHYQQLKEGILHAARNNEFVIFASGHDHSLQYFDEGNQHFIISGAGSKLDFAKAGGKAAMVHSAMGYAVLHFYENETVWLDFVVVDKDRQNGEVFFSTQLLPN